jgi:hypothetical protein
MTDVFSSLEAVKSFLNEQVEADVPAHLRGDVRAAAKLLGDVAAEFDALPCLLYAEGLAMLALQEEALAYVEPPRRDVARVDSLRRQLALPLGSVRELQKLHDELKSEAEAVLVGLQADLRREDLSADLRARATELVARYYRHFAAQADARLPWQSVFEAGRWGVGSKAAPGAAARERHE